jgi:hypothetical protein
VLTAQKSRLAGDCGVAEPVCSISEARSEFPILMTSAPNASMSVTSVYSTSARYAATSSEGPTPTNRGVPPSDPASIRNVPRKLVGLERILTRLWKKLPMPIRPKKKRYRHVDVVSAAE